MWKVSAVHSLEIWTLREPATVALGRRRMQPYFEEPAALFWEDASDGNSTSLVGHQENKGSHVIFRGPAPIAQKDCVDHQPGLALAKQ
jgi:hypothetical protein